MNQDLIVSAQHVSDQDLLRRVKDLAQQEREATVALVAHLAIFDERSLYLGEGYPSLFSYCTEVLRLSEHAAYNRIQAARAGRRFPLILERLANGSVTLTAVRLLAPHFTAANHRELLAAAQYKGKKELEELIAQIHPQPSAPSTIRKLPPPAGHASLATTSLTTRAERTTTNPTLDALTETALNGPHDHLSTPALVSLPVRPTVIEPLGLRRYRVQFTASVETHDKLLLAQDLLRHQIPDGDLGEIFDRALTLLLEAIARQKCAATARPRACAADGNDAPASASRHIPAAVKRTVWLRDGGRCAFVASNGRRCAARGFLEFHHVEPYAAGGAATSDNIELRCRAHNRHEAVLYFTSPPVVPPHTGDTTMSRKQQTAMAHPTRAGPD